MSGIKNEKTISAATKQNVSVAASKNSISGDDIKEEVNDTILEIETERANARKKPTPLWLKILAVVFFPISGLIALFKVFQKKVKIPLTVKMTIIFTLMFVFLLIIFMALMTASVDSQLPETEDAQKYLTSFKIAEVVSFFIIMVFFVSLGLVISQFMLRPIKKMTTEIDNITADNLKARLEPVDSQDELCELTDRINGMLTNIEESFFRQQNFVADASHELKTPIAVIQGYADMLKRWGKSDPAILDEGIESIANEATNMKRIVEQLLLLARLGKMAMTPSEFNLSELVSDIASDYRLVAKNHTINFDGEEDITINADKNMITESVRTLVDNAIKYSKNGGIVNVSVKTKGDNALIVIEDNGVGISEKDLPHIFDRFYRCDKARGREAGSSGLGLTIAKTIVENNGGTISVSSELGKGSEFIITLV